MLLLLLLLKSFCFCFPCLSRKARRAPQQSRAEEAPCLSEASLGAVPCFARSAGDRCAASACVPARSGFASF
ncbi:hypothetical protein EA658_17265 [Pseudoxanthomonas winnipegensis]|uniref:Secreted protein n=1 Tax=Pseudoxanthomonas winnipegensis TaxID=2480810 RepID=A0ABY1WAJ5_9GAMM|nr:hypothetical protein EA659_16770 [Pseudoxanthomonas winnipegensis]TAA17561.1 hypothetical protein EA658_17265 [Pseudoxanthomonas winnipegensis]TAH71280.1 hypothetical protein EA657_13805 [Pseudoxanthomonas winnipegensis]